MYVPHKTQGYGQGMPFEMTHLYLLESDAVPRWIKPYIPSITNLLFGSLILLVGWAISKWVNRALLGGLRKAHVEEALARFLASIAQYSILAATVISALNRVGVQTTSLVALLASAGLAVGLALQGSLSSFASGVMILFFRPFMLGDVVKIANHEGSVEDIGLFQTTLSSGQGEKIILPNNSVMNNPIINYTARGVRRATIEFGVAYGSQVELVIAKMKKAVGRVKTGLSDPEPAYVLSGLGDASLTFKVGVWCRSKEYGQTLTRLREELYAEFSEAGVDLPFPKLVLHPDADKHAA